MAKIRRRLLRALSWAVLFVAAALAGIWVGSDKLAAIGFMAPPTLRKGRFRPPDKLIALLKGRSLWGVKYRIQTAGTRSTPTNSP